MDLKTATSPITIKQQANQSGTCLSWKGYIRICLLEDLLEHSVTFIPFVTNQIRISVICLVIDRRDMFLFVSVLMQKQATLKPLLCLPLFVFFLGVCLFGCDRSCIY